MERDPEHQHGDAKPQADDHIRKNDVGVNENAEGGHKYQGGIEAGHIGGEQAASGDIHRQEKTKRIDRERQPGGPILGPKESEAGCHAPVQQRSLFEVANTVGVEGNPVMPHNHFPRNFGMHRVGIVQQRRTEKRKACVEKQPQTGKGEDDFPRSLRHIYYDSGLQKQRW